LSARPAGEAFHPKEIKQWILPFVLPLRAQSDTR
jgi:hypothetical protein